jgi:hypothetical protein
VHSRPRRLDFCSGTWGLRAWDEFESKFPSRRVLASSLHRSGSSTSGAFNVGVKVENVPSAFVSLDTRGSNVIAADVGVPAAALASSTNVHRALEQNRDQLPAQPPPAIEPVVEQGDGSEFWS